MLVISVIRLNFSNIFNIKNAGNFSNVSNIGSADNLCNVGEIKNWVISVMLVISEMQII